MNDKSIYSVLVSDDFQYWSRCGKSDDSGKVLLIDSNLHDISSLSDTAAGQTSNKIPTISMFFDDNIERDRAHIVDVRDQDTFECIPFESSKRVYLRRVKPLKAIYDRDYFLKEIDSALRHYKYHNLLNPGHRFYQLR